MRWRHALGLVALSLAGAACHASATAELPRLAERPPLAVSAMITGGAFVEPARTSSVAPSRRTFALDGLEAIGLPDLGGVLGNARVFVRVAVDDRSGDRRREVAQATWPLPVDATSMHAFLEQARADGHDFLLVVERLEDGPVEAQGINGQWPITLATWLLVGLGVVIPDHSYESRASLRASLRDVHDGQLVQEIVVEAGPVDLSLLQRTDVWGVVASILIPPFWVGDDDARVEDQLRRVGRSRLLWSLAQRLKTVDIADRIARAAPAEASVRNGERGRVLDLLAKEPLSFVRLRIDGQAWTGPEFERFHTELTANRVGDAGTLRYSAGLPAALRGRRLQVITQTVTGRVGSMTVSLEDVR